MLYRAIFNTAVDEVISSDELCKLRDSTREGQRLSTLGIFLLNRQIHHESASIFWVEYSYV